MDRAVSGRAGRFGIPLASALSSQGEGEVGLTENLKQVAKSTSKARVTKSVRKAPARARRVQTKAKKAATPSVASRLPPVTPEKIEAAKQKFERGILTRGEAVPAGTPLPPGATHEIVGTNPDGTPILKRKRFSMK